MNETLRQRRYRTRALQVKAPREPNPLAWRIGLLLMVFLCGGLYYIWLRSATDGLDKELGKVKRDCSNAFKERDNLQMAMERFTSYAYLTQEARRRNLGLREYTPGQIRCLTLQTRSARSGLDEDASGPDRGLAAQNPSSLSTYP